MVLFRGTAHPPASAVRKHAADLSEAEIRITNMGGKPMLLEHDPSERIGSVLSSWRGPRGDLRVLGEVTDASAEKQLRNGTLRGLSIGTSMTTDSNGKNLVRNPEELSLCAEGRRPGTWIDEVDGRAVRSVANFSKAGTHQPRYLITLAGVT